MPYIRITKDLPGMFLKAGDEVKVKEIYALGGTYYERDDLESRFIFDDEFELIPNKEIEYYI
jgi:hypothetical protein